MAHQEAEQLTSTFGSVSATFGVTLETEQKIYLTSLMSCLIVLPLHAPSLRSFFSLSFSSQVTHLICRDIPQPLTLKCFIPSLQLSQSCRWNGIAVRSMCPSEIVRYRYLYIFENFVVARLTDHRSMCLAILIGVVAPTVF